MFKKLATAAAVASLMLFSHAGHAADEPTLRVALIDPMSGPMAAAGVPYLEHMQMEAKRFNESGNLLAGHKLEIIGFDSKLNPQESLLQLQKGIDDGIRFFIQGTSSGVTAALIGAVDKYNRRNPDDPVLFFNYGGVDPEFTNEKCSFWHFRFDANASMKMDALSSWIAGQDSVKKVFLINQDYSFGRQVSADAKNMLAEKRPDIEVVGDVFHALNKVKDFSPYIAQIKASGADAVVTGNYGADIILLVKAAADLGLDIPFLTFYANSVGTVTQLGKDGADRVYVVGTWDYDVSQPEMLERRERLDEQTGGEWYYHDMRSTYAMEYFRKAANQAGSVNPLDVAWALEGLEFDGPAGKSVMRAEDHQLLAPLYIDVLKDGQEYGIEGTDMTFVGVKKYSAEDTEMDTTCKMKRPKKPA